MQNHKVLIFCSIRGFKHETSNPIKVFCNSTNAQIDITLSVVPFILP